MKFGFIGGTPRGYELFQALLYNQHKPEFCFILKEDEHENVKVSTEFLELANNNAVIASVKKKLVAEDYSLIKSQSLDFIIVCGWRTLINCDIIDNLKLGIIAAHDSLLPKYRGFAPLNWAIINGETETGVTLFAINEGEVDSGDILLQEKVSIELNDNALDVYKKITAATITAYMKIIKNYIENNKVDFIQQDEREATYTCKRTPEDGKINWENSSLKIYNLIRALAFPYSGSYFYYDNQKYEIRAASLGPQNAKIFTGNIPGRIIRISNEGIEVLCGSGTILIKEIYENKSNLVLPANQLFKSIAIKLL